MKKQQLILLVLLFTAIVFSSCEKKKDWRCSCCETVFGEPYVDDFQGLTEEEAEEQCFESENQYVCEDCELEER